MACIVTSTSNTNTQPICSPIASVADIVQRKRPPNSLFDYGCSNSKRICRCSDQYAAEFGDHQQIINENFIDKRDNAAFSFARAILNNTSDSNQCSLMKNNNSDMSSTYIKRTIDEKQTKNNTHSTGDLVSLAIHQTLESSKSNTMIGRRGSIQRPYLFKKLLDRLQQEVRYLDRQQKNLTKPFSQTNEINIKAKNLSADGDESTHKLSGSVSENSLMSEDILNDNSCRRMYTFRQLCRLCRKLLKEQEKLLHEFYEKSLTTRLSEQYDCFLRFTQEQLNSKFSHSEAPSYIS